MDNNVTFGLVSCFAGQKLKSIACNFLSECLKSVDGTSDSVKDWFDESVASIIPLFLCETRDDLKRKGATCPYEFIIERNDLLPTIDEKGHLQDFPIKIIAMRLSTLKKLYGGRTHEDFTNCMRDWFAGVFRRYLGLNATTHGTSDSVDLERVKKRKDPILMCMAGFARSEIEQHCNVTFTEYQYKNDIEKNATILHNRFIYESDLCGDSLIKCRSFVQKLFPEYFIKWGTKENPDLKSVNHSIVKALGFDAPKDCLEALCSIYYDGERQPVKPVTTEENDTRRKIPVKGGDAFCIVPRNHNERLPLAFGDRAKYVTPSGKLNLLLIDDKVNESPFGCPEEEQENVPEKFSASISIDDWKLLCDLFNVQAIPIDETGDIYENARRCFQKFQREGLTYDLILVDLCLGNNRCEDDLSGYTMIQIVKEFFPGTPIVVYSRFSDMEHIARAFASGAKWFLVKGEEAKLPRHILKLLRQVSWDREWRAIQNSSNSPIWNGDESSSFFQKFQRTPQWKYLTYKSLESFPGRFIALKKMGGGISTAVTFKATKGVKLGENSLQAPSIIKIDTSFNTMMEYERYFRMIRPYIANEAGRVEMPERVLNRDYSSIVYTFAGKQDQAHTLESMGDILDDNVTSQSACDYEMYRYALTCIFDEILPKIHRVSPELENGAIGKENVLPSDVKDAFSWEETYVKDDATTGRTSFPNYYFCEFLPSEFWKSYLMRMQCWGRITVDFVDGQDGNCKVSKWPFKKQKTFPLTMTQCSEGTSKVDGFINEVAPKGIRLIFHNVMLDPFATPKSKDAGKYIIEANTTDRKLVWLEGDVCNFVARFRKHLTPGAPLWFDANALTNANLDKKTGNLQEPPEPPNSKNERLEWLNNYSEDERLEWLIKSLEKAEKSAELQDGSLVTSFEEAVKQLAMVNVEVDASKKGLTFYIRLQDSLLKIAKDVAKGKAKEWEMKCPIGIVHGDLNVRNIMLESRKHPPKDDNPDVTQTVSDVWLIDFARTRRDLIAHDFNVFFTSVLGELFTEDLIGKEGKEKSTHQEEYWKKLVSNFKVIVLDAVAPASKSEKGVPDEIKDDQRFTLIYRILRRTHEAARKAGVSQNMYLLTTALAALYTVKIFLNNGCKVRLAAGYFAVAWICYDKLCEALGIKNVMEDFNHKDVNTGQADAKAGTDATADGSATLPKKGGAK